jgi:type IV pilus assembly protein PilW
MKTLTMKNHSIGTFGGASEHGKSSFERGFTLIELLIALLIGAIVIAVVGGLFLANTNTFRAVDDTSRLQENGRFALQTIARVTRQAGFSPVDILQVYSEEKKENAFPINTLAASTTARFVLGTDATGPNNSDSLAVAFRPSANGEVVDCTGAQQSLAVVAINVTPATIPPPIINTFFVAPSNPVDATSRFSLFCAQNATGANPIELIRGVESFQVLYAVDLPNPPATPGGPVTRDYTPNYYTSADQLTGDLFNNVTALQIALVLRGGERSTLDTSLTGSQLTLNLFGTDVNGAALYTGDVGATYLISGADNIRRTFKVITSTINLRNRSG